MTHTMLKYSILSALVFTGCNADDEGGSSERSAIQLRLLGDVDAVREKVSSLEVVLNHEIEYERDSTRINTDWMDLTDYDDDGLIELVLTIDATTGGEYLPLVELRPGNNTSPFTVMVHGITDEGEWVFTEAPVGPLSFTKEVQVIDVDLQVRNVAAHGCNNGVDDDNDGWLDEYDPDCANGGKEELGFGTNECNDGIDNELEPDGLIDSEDDVCEDAYGEAHCPLKSRDDVLVGEAGKYILNDFAVPYVRVSHSNRKVQKVVDDEHQDDDTTPTHGSYGVISVEPGAAPIVYGAGCLGGTCQLEGAPDVSSNGSQ